MRKRPPSMRTMPSVEPASAWVMGSAVGTSMSGGRLPACPPEVDSRAIEVDWLSWVACCCWCCWMAWRALGVQQAFLAGVVLECESVISVAL